MTLHLNDEVAVKIAKFLTEKRIKFRYAYLKSEAFRDRPNSFYIYESNDSGKIEELQKFRYEIDAEHRQLMDYVHRS